MKKSIKSGNRVNGPKSPQCGKDRHFHPLRFYVKLMSMSSLTHLEALNLDFSEFLHLLRTEICPNQKSRASNIAKMTFFELPKIDFT